MAKRTKEELLAQMKHFETETPSDEYINMLEDISDTYDSIGDGAGDWEAKYRELEVSADKRYNELNQTWEQKYNENDRMLRKRYTDRFYFGPEPEKHDVDVEISPSYVEPEEAEIPDYSKYKININESEGTNNAEKSDNG